MKLLYSLTNYPPSVGGAQIHHHLLAQSMCKRQHSVQAFTHWNSNRTDWLLGTTLKAPFVSHEYCIDSISVHCTSFSISEKLRLIPSVCFYYPFKKGSLSCIAGLIEQKLNPFSVKADLVHNVRIGRAGITQASLLSARRCKIPFILTPVHHPRWKGWRYRAYNQLYRQADAVIALTQAEKNILIDLGVDPARIHVTGVGPVLSEASNPPCFRKRLGLADEPSILFLGQHYTYKGFSQLLSAAPLVWEKFPESNIVFVRPPVRDSEREFLRNTEPRIHRLGQVSLQEKTDALSACTLLCVPSLQESFGGVYTEAWSFKKPVIGGNIPAIAEQITKGMYGYLTSQQPNDIAAQITKLLQDPLKAAQMGRAGYQKVAARFTWEKLALATESIYKSVLSSS